MEAPVLEFSAKTREGSSFVDDSGSTWSRYWSLSLEESSAKHAEPRRLQTIPDDVCIVGERTAVQRQIGNAVPSLLGEVLGRGDLDTDS